MSRTTLLASAILSRFFSSVGFGFVLLLVLVTLWFPQPAAAAIEVPADSWWGRVVLQVEKVWSVATTAAKRVFSGDALLVAQLGGASNQLVAPEDLPRVPSGYVPSATTERGSLVFNTPLFIDDALQVTGNSTFGTATILGLLTAESMQSLTTLTAASLGVTGNATFGLFQTFGDATIDGVLQARGGITTDGADVNLGSGQLFASNIVNEVIAGDNVSITGPTSNPVISVNLDDFDVVNSLNGETGNIDLEAGDDIEINGLTISNESTLSSVRNRGGCSSCLLDGDVSDILTIAGGSINNTIIGASTPAAAFFTTVSLATTTVTQSFTITSLATSTFGGSINITSGCFAINGVCIEGVEPSTYVGLTDTPNSLIAGALQFANASGTAVAQDSGLVFLNGRLGVGTSTPESTLSVVGNAAFIGTAFTVLTSTSSQFDGGLNVTNGCVSVNGVCIGGATELGGLDDVTLSSTTAGDVLEFNGTEWRNVAFSDLVGGFGLGDGTFLGLSDTPSSYIAGALSFVNGTGSALTQSANLVFSGGNLGVGTSTPATRLSVDGDVSLLTASALRFYSNDSTNYVGFRASSTIAVNTVWTLPATDGGANQVLYTDGNGNLAFADLSVLGAGASNYLELTDTPSSYVAGAIQFANATSSGLTQSSNFVFTGGNLGVGTNTPGSRLSVGGNIAVLAGNALRFYSNDSSRFVGFRASSTLSTDTVWTLPGADGGLNQVLVTDGSGNLRFADVSAIGGGVSAYLQLTDTPSSYVAGAIPFTNASGTALVHSSSLVFTGTNLGIGTSSPSTRLAVNGSVRFTGPSNQPGFFYNQGGVQLGLGTNNPTDRLSILGGSILQRGGIAGSSYGPTFLGGTVLTDSATDVDVVGNYAYVTTNGFGNDFRVIDISNPQSPTQVASLNLVTGALTVAVRGKYAYVGTSFSGNDFHVIDISNPLAPVEVASINMAAGVNDIVLAGRYAYAVTDATGNDFHVIDISNPLAPVEVGSVNLADTANGVAVSGNYAFVVTTLIGNDFHVIDISNPTAPVEVSSINLPDTANKVIVSGQYAYATSDSTGNDVHVINISNPLAPVEVGGVNLVTGARGLSLAGNYLYVTSLGTGNDLHVIDVTSPTTPVEVGGADTVAGDGLSVKVVGRYAYMTTSSGGNDFHVVDISGASLQSVLAGSVSGGVLSVVTDITAGGRINAGLGIYSGIEGVQTDGSLSVLGTNASYIAGSLGIGTTSTSSKLTVAGSIRSSSLLGGSVNLTTDANGVIIRDPSDERLKENITDVENALDILTELRGVRYEWRDKERFGDQIEIGFIAQEVDQVLPEVVRKGGEYWSLNTRNILAIVVEGVKEIWAIVQGHSRQITELETRVAELEAALGSATSAPEPAVSEPIVTPVDEPQDVAPEGVPEIIEVLTDSPAPEIFGEGDGPTDQVTEAVLVDEDEAIAESDI